MKRGDKFLKLEMEITLQKDGYNLVCGIDEAGRGCWAGPLVAAAVILKKDLDGIADSKLLTSQKREEVVEKIKQNSYWGVGVVESQEIDKLKMTKATTLAFTRAINALQKKPDFILSDAFSIDLGIPNKAVIRGDQTHACIAAASIVAKTFRDNLMCKLSQVFQSYGFELHKGYGTKYHREKIAEFGVCELHRRSFKPIKILLSD